MNVLRQLPILVVLCILEYDKPNPTGMYEIGRIIGASVIEGVKQTLLSWGELIFYNVYSGTYCCPGVLTVGGSLLYYHEWWSWLEEAERRVQLWPTLEKEILERRCQTFCLVTLFLLTSQHFRHCYGLPLCTLLPCWWRLYQTSVQSVRPLGCRL